MRCVLGPHAGELVPDRGLYWRVVAHVALPPASDEPDSWQLELVAPVPRVRPGWAGTYVRQGGEYVWQEDR
jgi:hypothetical protein